MKATTLLAGRNLFVRLFAAFTAFTALLLVPLAATAQGSVNLYTGDSTYTVPIVTPPGTNGVGPSLSLNYNSSGGSDWLGNGWTLQGLGSIDRLGPTYSPSPTYTASDSFRLNFAGGGKLVYAGTDPAGNVGNYYRTEIESFLRIEFVSASNYWVVTDKGGTKYFFGQTAASQQNNPGNAAQVFSWKLDKVLDTHGVFWTATYDKDIYGGDMYPKQIVYSQSGNLACTPINLAACRVVNFIYQSRTDPVTSYRTGAKIVSDQLLQRIDVYLGGQLTRNYNLYYVYYNPVTARIYRAVSQLESIQEAGADGISSGPRLSFTYNVDVYAASAGLAKVDMIGSPAEGLGGPLTNPASPSNCTYSVDMNGDKLPDILVGQAGSWYYYPRIEFGFTYGPKVAIANPATPLPSLCTTRTDIVRHWSVDHNMGLINLFTFGMFGSSWTNTEVVRPVFETVLMDIDGDGLPDIFYSPAVGQWYWWRGLGNGQFMDRTSIVGGPVTIQLNDPNVRLVDMDGDGLADIVQFVKVKNVAFPYDSVSKWTLNVFQNRGNGSFSPQAISLNVTLNHAVPDGAAYPTGYGTPTVPASDIFMMDMNGDGLPDLVWTSVRADSTVNVYYLPNQGLLNPAGFGPRVTLQQSTGAGLRLKGFNYSIPEWVRMVDMNGDGLPDILYADANFYGYYPLQSNGTYGGFVTMSNPPSVALTRDNFMTITDANGDGFPDIFQGTPGSYAYYFMPMNGNHRNLFYATNTMGGVQAFTYARNRSGNTIRWVTETSTIGDGLPGGTATIGRSYYNFFDGKNIGWPQNEFRGYAAASARNDAGHEIRTFFLQDDAMKGRISGVYYNDKVGAPLPRRDDYNTYIVTSPVPGVSRVDLGYSQEYYSAYGGTGGDKFKKTQFQNYDRYGNPGLVTVSGSDIAARVTATDFIYNTAAYIVNSPSHTAIRMDSATGTKISEAWFEYDGLANGTAPAKGDLSRTTHWLSEGPNSVMMYGYDAVGNHVGAIDANANRLGRVVSSLCATTGYTARVVYDTTYLTFPVSETNALCQTTTKTYWGVNNTALAAASVTGAFAVPGLAASVTDLNGIRSDSYWDVYGHLKASVMPPDTAAAPTIVWSYDMWSVPRTVFESRRESAGGGTLDKYTYVDGFGRTIQVKSEAETAGQWVTKDTLYNNRGLVETTYVPYLSTYGYYSARALYSSPRTTTLYDPLLRPSRVTNPDGTFRTTVYSGWTVTNTDEKNFVTTRNYDALQRLISVVEPVGGGSTTRYYYDYFDTTTSHNFQFIIDAFGNTTQTEFDTLGRNLSSLDPDRGWRLYTYDANGNMLTQRDAKNQTLTFAYDKLNRVTTKTYPNATKVTNSYDDATAGAYRVGRLWKVTDPSGSTAITFDQRGRQTKVDKAIGATTFTTQSTYDSRDRLVDLTYPGGEVVNHSYNLQGLPAKVRSTTYAQDYIASLSYNAFGKVTARTAGNGIATAYDYYDAPAKGPTNFRLSRVWTPGLQYLTYSYDPAGNIGSVTDSIKAATQTFGYDNVHRLTSAASIAAPAFTHAYTYDLLGNMTTGAGKSFAYPLATASRPHAPTFDGAATYTYDANGSMATRVTGGVTRAYTWDYDNRLSQVKDGTTVLGTYTYDFAGNRVKKVEGAVTTLIPFPNYRTIGGAATTYYFANGERVAERTGGTAATNVYYYHPDHLGSSNTVSNSAGTEVKATLFYPYGATRTETGSKPIEQKYTGQDFDQWTGLYNYGARYYDPNLMHFISADNIIPSAADPQMLNRYSYVRNNPIRLRDPTGKSAAAHTGDFFISGDDDSDYLTPAQRNAVSPDWLDTTAATYCPSCLGASVLAIGYSAGIGAGIASWATTTYGLSEGAGLFIAGSTGSLVMSPGTQYLGSGFTSYLTTGVATHQVTAKGMLLDTIFGGIFQRALGVTKAFSDRLFPNSKFLASQTNFLLGGVGVGGFLITGRARLEGASGEQALIAAGASRVFPSWLIYSFGNYTFSTTERKLFWAGTVARLAYQASAYGARLLDLGSYDSNDSSSSYYGSYDYYDSYDSSSSYAPLRIEIENGCFSDCAED
jgi:RHS repeat-associated protein